MESCASSEPGRQCSDSVSTDPTYSNSRCLSPQCEMHTLMTGLLDSEVWVLKSQVFSMGRDSRERRPMDLEVKIDADVVHCRVQSRNYYSVHSSLTRKVCRNPLTLTTVGDSFFALKVETQAEIMQTFAR